MATKKYNPYNDIKSVVGYKGDWHNAKSFGQDPTRYYQEAMPYYQSLVNNGYGDIADRLSNMNYTEAKSLLGQYKPDEQFELDNAYSIISAEHPNDAGIDEMTGLINGTSPNSMASRVFDTAGGIATGAVGTQPSAATQGLFDAYSDSNERLNGAIRYDENGNVISGLNTEHYNIGRNQLDYLNNFDITKQPYYQGIMDAYHLGGLGAAQGAYASGAADNGGNIDSYAAANANRQQLAYTTAGMQAAMNLANQNQQNWQNLYSQMSQDLNNQGQLSLATLDIAKQMYATDANERMNALDVQGSLASQQMAAAVDQFQAMVQERMADKGISAEMAMQEADIAAAREQLEMELASNERIQEGINALGYYQTDAEKAMNAENAYTNRYMSDNTLAGTRYQADSSLAGTRYQTDANRYATDLNYQLGLAGYQNALDLARLNGEISEQAAASDAQRQREYNQWLLENGYTTDSKGNLVSAGSGTEGVVTGGYNADEADVFKYINDTVKAIKAHSDPSISSLSDAYWSAIQYDQIKYGGANKDFIDDYFEKEYKWRNYETGGNDASALLAALLS